MKQRDSKCFKRGKRPVESLDSFFTVFKQRLAPDYQIREVTLYFLTVLSVYLQPNERPTSNRITFKRQLSLDRALQMFCTGVQQKGTIQQD